MHDRVDGRFKEANASFVSGLGYDADELLSNRYDDLIHPEDRTASCIEAACLANAGKLLSFENRYLHAGKLGVVPPAVAEFVETVMGHHQAALDQWNRVLGVGGQPEVAASTASLQPTVDDAFAVVSDVAGAARLALMLEEIAAATYLAAIPNLASPEAIALVASIYPIDMQHAAVLRFVMGEYPVPYVFGKVDLAATPA